MAIARIASQSTGVSVLTASTNLAMPVNVTNGNVVFVGVNAYKNGASPTTPTVVKASGTATIGTVTEEAFNQSNISTEYTRVSIMRVPITGTGSLTLTIGTDGTSLTVGVDEFSGVGAKDGSAVTNTATSTSETTGNVVVAGASLIFTISAEFNASASTHTSISDNVVFEQGNSTYNGSLIQDKLCATSGTYALTSTIANSMLWFTVAQAYAPAAVGAPLIDALSETDAGFTAGHPFASGAAKDYTVQSALTASTQYFWRVRAKDPSGTNTFGAWSTIRSFTTGTGGGGGTYTKPHTLDGIVKETKTTTHTLNGIVKEINTDTHTVDGVVKESKTSTHTLSGIVKETKETTHALTAIVKEIKTTTHALDGIVFVAAGAQTITHTLDGVVKETKTAAHTTDAIVKETKTTTNTVDAIVKASTTKTHSVDGVVKESKTTTHSLDGNVKATSTATHSLDGIVTAAGQATKTHTADGIVKATNTATHILDAAVAARTTTTHSVDAVVKESKTSTHTLSGIVAARNSATHTLDAAVKASNTANHTLSATIVDTSITYPTQIFIVNTGKIAVWVGDDNYLQL